MGGAPLSNDCEFCPKCGERRRFAGTELGPRLALDCCCRFCSICTLMVFLFGVVVVIYLNDWIEFAVETVGSAVLGVDVTLQSINVGLIQGSVSGTSLSIGSPEGF